MGYKTGEDRQQLALIPACLDDYVPEDHICRVISAFTGQLDMAALGYKYAECKSTGCRPYDPRMMLNLYIYGYLHRVRSSRRLRDEAKRNMEVMWLMDGLTPDDKTISNFRTDNGRALRETFRAFVMMGRRLGLYGEETVATDSTKFRANNSRKHHHNRTTVKNDLSRIEKKISEYMNALEQADREEAGENIPEKEAIRAALEMLRERKVKFAGLAAQVEEAGEVSTVDPDARMVRSGGDARKLDVGYNVQTVVDDKYHMIVDFEVNNCSSDSGCLHRMSRQAKEILEVESLTNLADAGYHNGEDIAACEGDGVTCLVTKGESPGEAKQKGFKHSSFIYDRETDSYTCPCGNEMRYRHNKTSKGKSYRVYANYGACRACVRKPECTTYHYREVVRLQCQDVLDIVDRRTRENKELYRLRQEIVEHPFGTVKAVWGYKQFLCRGKANVITETALAYLAYNMRRVFTIFTESRLQPAWE